MQQISQPFVKCKPICPKFQKPQDTILLATYIIPYSMIWFWYLAWRSFKRKCGGLNMWVIYIFFRILDDIFVIFREWNAGMFTLSTNQSRTEVSYSGARHNWFTTTSKLDIHGITWCLIFAISSPMHYTIEPRLSIQSMGECVTFKQPRGGWKQCR